MSTDTNDQSIYEQMSSLELFPIGFPVLINKHADPSYRANLNIATKMKMVDLVPTGFTLNYESLTSTSSGNNESSSEILKFDYQFYIDEYRKKLRAIMGSAYDGAIDRTYGARLWITSESTGMDNIQNQFTDNSISGWINTQIQNKGLGEFHKMLRSGGMGNLISSFPNNVPLNARILYNAVVEGRHVSLPKIWQDTTYDNNFQFTIKLSSPYGSKEAIKRFIGEPLMRLICLISPSSSDGITYGLPPYLYVKAYGLTFMNIAIPQNIQISRGQEDRVNAYKQPLDIVVTLTVVSAIPGYGALISERGDPNVNGIIEDVVLSDMTGSGLGLEDVTSLYNNERSGPAINTVGNILKSIMPVPDQIKNQNMFNNSVGGAIDLIRGLIA